MKRRAPQYYCTTLYYFALHSITLYYTVLLRTILYYLGEARNFFPKMMASGPLNGFDYKFFRFELEINRPYTTPHQGLRHTLITIENPPRIITISAGPELLYYCATQYYFALHSVI